MHLIKLTEVCSQMERIFSGNREDWGSRVEAAFEVCENLAEKLPDEVVEIQDRYCTVGDIVRMIQSRFQYHIGSDQEGLIYLDELFGNVILPDDV